MLNAFRFLMLLSLAVWLGGIIFFGAVMAPALFSTLPSRHLAGAVVTRTLSSLHIIGLICGVLFLAASAAHSYLTRGSVQLLTTAHLLVVLMLVLTLVSQFAIAPKMAALRAEMGIIDDIPINDARRLEFNRLHVWSTRLEMGVLFLGLGVLWFVARRLT
jgi:hypothetical protein